jgi:acetoin utilization deacetylase AcuC-like enzyme
MKIQPEENKKRELDKNIRLGLNSRKRNVKKKSRTLTNQKSREGADKMKIIVHPKVATFKRPGFLEEFSFKDFAREDFFRRDIPNGEEFLKLVHTEKYIRKIKKACEVKAFLAEMKLTPECYEIACLGVGTVILASGEGNFAIQCMTGHHAGRETAMGFNLFNSMAIAAQRLVSQGKKVCIIDIDGHHGNGTQSIFYDTNQVLYCSIHQEGAFPGTGSKKEIGRGRGRGYTFNIPLSRGSGDDIFLQALEEIIKKATDFKPDIVGVYAGFDGYYADRLLDLNYTLKGFYECGRIIGQNFAQVFAELGGGYHQDLTKCILAFVAGINQEKYLY